MKDYFNVITINWKDNWQAGGSYPIQAGTHLNPREQVRSYARELRERIIREILPPRMQTGPNQWNKLKFQTAVCFTNPRANLLRAVKYAEERPPELEPWEEKFSILDIEHFTNWIRKLRFGLQQDTSITHEPYRLQPATIVKVATQILGLVEWTEIYPALPTPHPFGHLVLEDSEGRQIFNLAEDHSLIGRSHECDVVLPDRYGKVSAKHCVIHRTLNGITVTDYPSRNGTYKEDQRVDQARSTKLEHGDILTLGGRSSSKEPCVLRFELYGKESYHTKITEHSTRSFLDRS